MKLQFTSCPQIVTLRKTYSESYSFGVKAHYRTCIYTEGTFLLLWYMMRLFKTCLIYAISPFWLALKKKKKNQEKGVSSVYGGQEK